jgi:hypothetical protein
MEAAGDRHREDRPDEDQQQQAQKRDAQSRENVAPQWRHALGRAAVHPHDHRPQHDRQRRDKPQRHIALERERQLHNLAGPFRKDAQQSENHIHHARFSLIPSCVIWPC